MNQESSFSRTIDTLVRLGVLALLLVWCFNILSPFIGPVIWGMVIAVAVYPVHRRLSGSAGKRNKLSAALITLVFLAILVIPMVLLTTSLVEGSQAIFDMISDENFSMGPPPDGLQTWPLIGDFLYNSWQMASTNISGFLRQYADQLTSMGGWLIAVVAGTGIGVIQFIFSIILAGVLLSFSEPGSQTARQLFIRLAGEENGPEFLRVTNVTIGNVTKGILGVAIIQSLGAGLGFLVAGVPAAGLWALLALLLAVIQIGIAPIVIPVIIYMFSASDTLTASLLTAWLVIVLASDNVLKPILLGRGAPVPMMVIFLGSIGGFLLSGIIGLFVGAVVLSLGYKLFMSWLYLSSENNNPETESADSATGSPPESTPDESEAAAS